MRRIAYIIVLLPILLLMFVNTVQAQRTCCINGWDPNTCGACIPQETKNNGTSCGGNPNCVECPPDRPVANACGTTCTPGGTSCGSCNCPNGSTGNQNCSNGCSNWSQSCTCCSPSNPTAVTLINPANNSTITTNNPTFSWNSTPGWGKGCPQNNSYIIRYRVYNGTCDGNVSAYTSIGTGTSTSRQIPGLNYGTTYCWMVTTSNGSRSADSARWIFTTPTPPAHSITSVMTNTCGSQISGRAGDTGTDNPITVMSEYVHPLGVANINQVSIAIIPNTILNSPIIAENVAMQQGFNYFMASASINHSNVNSTSFAVVNNSTTYSSGTTSGNISPSGAKSTLMNINGTTSVNNTHIQIVNPTTLRVYWQIRFENNYPLSTNNIYSAAYSHTGSEWISTSAISGIAGRALMRTITWGVDVTPPSVSVSKPNPINSTDFSIQWAASGNSIVNTQGYMWTSEMPVSLNRLSPTNNTFNITTTEPADFSPTNIAVTNANLGNHTYRLPAISNPTENINTKIVAKDSACNVAIANRATKISNEWILTAFGDVFTKNVQTTINVSNLENISSKLTSAYSYFASYTNSLRDNSLKISSRTSKQSFILSGYDDWNSVPPKTSSYTNWYDYLFNLVKKNKGSITDKPALTIANNNTASIFGVTAYDLNNTKSIRYTGNLQLGPSITCNTRSIVFVEGNLLIKPPFTISNSGTGDQMGCMFIVKGNIGIDSGTNSTFPTTTTTKFDIVEAFFITDNDFYTKLDNRGSINNTIYDGLYLKGSIIAKNDIHLKRDLKLFANAEYPAELIEYDPRYTQIFQNELKIIKFSVREKDFIRKMTK